MLGVVVFPMAPAYVPHPAVPRQAPRTFDELVKASDDELDVLSGALLIAEDFSSDPRRTEIARKTLDALVSPIAGLDLRPRSLEENAQLLREELFERAGFVGNQDDYYDPRNSFLPDVLERRRGIPISLALVYIEVAQRVGIQARGVGFPGHFLVRLDSPRETEPLFIDPFFGGRTATPEILSELLSKTGAPAGVVPRELLNAITPRGFLQRILMNLRNVFLHRGEFAKALLVVDRVLTLSPALAEAILDRALLSERLGATAGAKASFEKYLRVATDEAHRKTAETHLEALNARPIRPN